MNITEEHSHTIHRQVTPRALFKDKTPVLSVVALCVSPQEVVSVSSAALPGHHRSNLLPYSGSGPGEGQCQRNTDDLAQLSLLIYHSRYIAQQI